MTFLMFLAHRVGSLQSGNGLATPSEKDFDKNEHRRIYTVQSAMIMVHFLTTLHKATISVRQR